jgi:hypothetical protein
MPGEWESGVEPSDGIKVERMDERKSLLCKKHYSKMHNACQAEKEAGNGED